MKRILALSITTLLLLCGCSSDKPAESSAPASGTPVVTTGEATPVQTQTPAAGDGAMITSEKISLDTEKEFDGTFTFMYDKSWELGEEEANSVTFAANSDAGVEMIYLNKLGTGMSKYQDGILDTAYQNFVKDTYTKSGDFELVRDVVEEDAQNGIAAYYLEYISQASSGTRINNIEYHFVINDTLYILRYMSTWEIESGQRGAINQLLHTIKAV